MVNIMKDYQLRVIAEKKELEAKIIKLDAFLNDDASLELSKEEHDLLIDQLGAMHLYRHKLRRRIQLYDKE